MIKLDPAEELTTFFNKSGIDFKSSRISEDSVACAFVKLASKYFTIEYEVYGVHKDPYPGGIERTLRIDAIFTPKKEVHMAEFGYHKPQPFGVEFKDPTKIGKTGNYSLADVFAQCNDYANCTFGDYGSIPVFMFPLFDHRVHLEVLNFLAKLNVGVITADMPWGQPSYAFRFGEMAYWTSKEGFTDFGKKRSMKKKYGNRA